MKTHKNPDLRLQTPQPYRPKPSPKPSIKTFGAKKMESVKPPKCVLENKKWVIVSGMTDTDTYYLTYNTFYGIVTE